MRFSVWVLIAALVALMGCGGGGVSQAPKSVSLAYKSLGGEYVQYKASTNITYNIGGTLRQSLMDITYSVRVDTIAPDGSSERRLKFDEFVMGELAGSRLNYDPDAEKYKGESLWLKLGPEGELVDWKGLDGVRGFSISDQDLKDDIVQMMAQLFQPYGEEMVTVGSTWQRILEIPIRRRGGEINQKIIIDYTVDGFGTKAGRSCVKIKTKTRFEGEGEGKMGEDKSFWVDAVGDGDGQIWFDYVNGVPVESTGKATITSDFSYERAGKEDVKTETATIDLEQKIRLSE